MTSRLKLSRFLVLGIVSFHAAQAAEPIPVSVAKLGELLVDQELRAPAVVISANHANLTSQITALISNVAKDVGDQVKKGDVLIRLDGANARHSLSRAEANLAAIDAQIVDAKSRLRKAEELLEKDFISNEELISRQSSLAVLQANRRGQLVVVSVAELELARTEVRAPFNAAVVARQAQVGSYAQPGTPLISIVQTDRIEIDVELDPRHSENIPQIAGFEFVSQGKSWPVTLMRLSQVIDISSRVVHARFQFAGDEAAIGTSGQLVWNEATGAVPVKLIVKRNNQLGLFVADQATAKFVAVPTAQEGRPALVNMPPEVLIIIRGHFRLQDGDALQVTHE